MAGDDQLLALIYVQILIKLIIFYTLRCFKDELTEVRISIETGPIINTDLEIRAESFGLVRKLLLKVW